MLKAVREAKTRTSWTDPDADYEKALETFIAAVLEPAEDAPFLADLARFTARVAAGGEWNALARVLLQLTAPGTPDTYRGDELWFFALVDPDNRRPVDYAARERLLHEPEDRSRDARKLQLMRRALHTRRAHPLLFSVGSYLPLEIRGGRSRHLVAFARVHGAERAIVVAPRLLASLPGAQDGSPDWGDTEIVLPSEVGGPDFQSVLDVGEVPLSTSALTLKAAEVLSVLPMALLLSSHGGG
jgi:(1->4)-alpha-D-glucan 1-alpha-D-glucosylmutase